MEDKLFSLFSDNPTLMSHCPVCNLSYDPIEARVIKEGNNAHLVYIKCRHCQSAVLTLIISGNLGISSVGLITDLNCDDVLKFRENEPITCNNVIEMHQLLAQEKAIIDYLN